MIEVTIFLLFSQPFSLTLLQTVQIKRNIPDSSLECLPCSSNPPLESPNHQIFKLASTWSAKPTRKCNPHRKSLTLAILSWSSLLKLSQLDMIWWIMELWYSTNKLLNFFLGNTSVWHWIFNRVVKHMWKKIRIIF